MRTMSQRPQALVDLMRDRLAALWERANRNGFVVLMNRTLQRFGVDQVPNSAASVAYFALFSIFPLLLALVAIFGFLIGTAAAQERVLSFLVAVLPVSQDLIARNVTAAIEARGVLGLIGVATLLWSATGVFSALTSGLNRAWDVPEGRPFLQQKLLEMGMTIGVGALLPVSFLGTVLLGLIGELGSAIPGTVALRGSVLLAVLLSLLPLIFSFGVFVAIYMVLPNTSVRFRYIWLPALIGALAFEVAKSLFAWYVANLANFQLVFGSLGAVVAFLFWAYISALIVLFGAELAAQYSKMRAEAEEHATRQRN